MKTLNLNVLEDLIKRSGIKDGDRLLDLAQRHISGAESIYIETDELARRLNIPTIEGYYLDPVIFEGEGTRGVKFEYREIEEMDLEEPFDAQEQLEDFLEEATLSPAQVRKIKRNFHLDSHVPWDDFTSMFKLVKGYTAEQFSEFLDSCGKEARVDQGWMNNYIRSFNVPQGR